MKVFNLIFLTITLTMGSLLAKDDVNIDRDLHNSGLSPNPNHNNGNSNNGDSQTNPPTPGSDNTDQEVAGNNNPSGISEERQSHGSPIPLPDIGVTEACGSNFYNPTYATCLDGKVIAKEGSTVGDEDILYNFETSPATITLQGFNGIIPMHLLTKFALRGYTANELKTLERQARATLSLPGQANDQSSSESETNNYQEELPSNFYP